MNVATPRRSGPDFPSRGVTAAVVDEQLCATDALGEHRLHVAVDQTVDVTRQQEGPDGDVRHLDEIVIRQEAWNISFTRRAGTFICSLANRSTISAANCTDEVPVKNDRSKVGSI